jgi:hypothetical protein
VAEGARLERVWARKGLVGSNPTLSANVIYNPLNSLYFSTCHKSSTTFCPTFLLRLDEVARDGATVCPACEFGSLISNPKTSCWDPKPSFSVAKDPLQLRDQRGPLRLAQGVEVLLPPLNGREFIDARQSQSVRKKSERSILS